MQIRQVEPRDYPAIDTAIAKPFWGGVCKDWLSHPDPEKVEQTLKGKTDKNSLIIEETYLQTINTQNKQLRLSCPKIALHKKV